jgi:hypothetical protein
MTNILLLGAGFSFNWGAPLASEVAASLLRRVGGADPELQRLLKEHDKNFENALSAVQRDYRSGPTDERKARLDRLQGGITDMFKDINAAFENNTNFEFSNDGKFSVRGFLARFDAIFTLNQDLLLELQYDNPLLRKGVQIPGMKPVLDPTITGIGNKHMRRWTPAPRSEFTIAPNAQPFIKIHGSSDWQTSDGAKLLVIGGNKDFMIREHEVLLWYYDLFTQFLNRGDARLMVIGYGFGDEHINEAIRQAGRTAKLKGIFLLDPGGRAILNKSSHLPVKVHDDLEDVPSLGGSTRTLNRIFGGDTIGFQELDGFFKSG